MREEELRKFFNVYTECWRFFRKYSSPTDDDEFWEKLINESSELVEKSERKELAKAIMLATIDEIERVYKEHKGE